TRATSSGTETRPIGIDFSRSPGFGPILPLLRLDRYPHCGVDDDPRADRVDPDAMRRHLARQRLGQADHGELGGAVAGEIGIAGLARPGSEVDDRTRTPRDHVR